MSSNQSNLSSSKYGYDMVVGTTQDSINATMKNYLSKYDGEEVIMCYVYDADVPEGQSTTVATDFDAYKEKLGFDPFDVPTPGDDEELDPRVQTLEDNFFLFAFKATMGLPSPPTGTPPNDAQDYMDNLPDIVVLGTSNSSVTYNLYCKEFQILDLELGGYGDVSWSNISQPTYPDNPWVFSFSVDLDLYNNDSAFNTLNTQTQNDVKNLCPDSMFSVQQLYLDLNTAGLESSPDIPNLDPNSQTAYYLTKIFLNTYLQDIQEKETSESNPDGNYMLGYTIQSSDSTSSSSVVPTDLNFMVSPFLDDQGNPSDNFSLYTLNWLIMTNTHSMPAPVPFEWNWVDEADQNNFSGSMSINKNFFVNFLNQVFSENLNTICMIPKCTVDAWTVSFDIEFSQEPNAQAYQLVSDDPSHVLTFYYHKTSSADDKAYLHTVQTSIECDYTLTSDVYFEGSTIRVVTTSDTYLSVSYTHLTLPTTPYV